MEMDETESHRFFKETFRFKCATICSLCQIVSGNDLNTILLTGLSDFNFDELVAPEIFEANGRDYGETVYDHSKCHIFQAHRSNGYLWMVNKILV